MVVRLALGDEVGQLGDEAVHPIRIGDESMRLAPLDDRGVVGVGDHGALGGHGVGVADHGEERLRLALAVDDPVGVEDLVPAMLRVRLREHGELGVGRVAPQAAEGALEVFDLVVAEREAEPLVELMQSRDGNGFQVSRRDVMEQARRLVERAQHRLRHAVMEPGGERRGIRAEVVHRAALDPNHRRKAAVARDVGGLRRPGRDGAEPRHDHENAAVGVLARRRAAVVEQRAQRAVFVRLERALELDEIAVFGAQRAQTGVDLLQRGEQLGESELRQGARPAKLKDFGH
jgi:hypothetical protein